MDLRVGGILKSAGSQRDHKSKRRVFISSVHRLSHFGVSRGKSYETSSGRHATQACTHRAREILYTKSKITVSNRQEHPLASKDHPDSPEGKSVGLPMFLRAAEPLAVVFGGPVFSTTLVGSTEFGGRRSKRSRPQVSRRGCLK